MAYILETATLTEVLRDTMCEGLPPKLEDGNNIVWSRAIVKVKKNNGKGCFCVAINDGFGNPVIKKIYGTPSGVVKILAIHPLVVLEKKDLPVFATISQKIDFLVDNGYTRALLEHKNEECIQGLIYQYCIREQNKNVAHELNYNQLSENEVITTNKNPSLFDETQEDFYFKKPSKQAVEQEIKINNNNKTIDNNEEKPKRRGRKKKSER